MQFNLFRRIKSDMSLLSQLSANFIKDSQLHAIYSIMVNKTRHRCTNINRRPQASNAPLHFQDQNKPDCCRHQFDDLKIRSHSPIPHAFTLSNSLPLAMFCSENMIFSTITTSLCHAIHNPHKCKLYPCAERWLTQ